MVDLPQFVFPNLKVCKRCDGTNRVRNLHGRPIVCPYQGPDHVTYPPDEYIYLHTRRGMYRRWDPWPGRVE